MRESKYLWKDSQAKLTPRKVHMGDQSWREMDACSLCQSTWVNCQIHWSWGSSLRIARDVDFKKHMIRWTKWSRGRAGDICREDNHHQDQKGGFAIWRNPHWKVHRLSHSHGFTELLCWSAMAGERGTNTKSTCMVTIEISTYEKEIVGMSGFKLVHVILQSWWESDEFQNGMSKSGTRKFEEHLNPWSLEKKGQWEGFQIWLVEMMQNAQIFCPSPAKLKLFKVPRRWLVFWCSSSSFNWNKTMKQIFSRLLKKQFFSEFYRHWCSVEPLVCVIHDITKSSSLLFGIIFNFVWLLDIQTDSKNIFHSSMRIGDRDETPYNLSNSEPKFW